MTLRILLNCLNFKNSLKIFGLLILTLPACLFSQDSLSYEELDSMERKAVKQGDLVLLRSLSKIHFEKAYAEKDSLQMAKALFKRALNEDFDKGIELADSIIRLTEHGDYKWYPGEGYHAKGYRYYLAGDDFRSLNSYLKLHEFALIKGNEAQVYSCLIAIAGIKSNNGLHYEGIDLYRKALAMFSGIKDFYFKSHTEQLRLYCNLSLSYLKMNSLDSARHAARKGISIAKQFKDTSRYYRNLIMANAQVDYYDVNYIKSRDSLSKYLKYYSGVSQAEKEYYLAKIAGKMRDSMTMYAYFNSIDSIVTATDVPIDNMEDVYQQLLIQASKANDKEQQLAYIDKLIYYDSLQTTFKRGVNQLATVGFNVPLLQREKKQLINELDGRDRIILYLYAAAGFILCFTLVVFYKNYKIKKRLNLLMNTEVEPINSNRNTKVELQISSDVLTKIKDGLVQFERERGFLDPGVTQESLAKSLGTNSSYLSMVTNSEKGINFSRYLKDLRVTYAINFLKENPEVATKYTMKGMSELFGFKSADSFSRALSSKLGVSTSDYLKRIKQES